MTVPLKSKLAHYRLTEKLGEGGMGIVWKAVDTRLDREVAIKFLHSSVLHDAERLHRFELEAKAVAALNHPNIVTIYSVEEANGTRFFTMELVRGKTLAALIPPGGLPLDRVLEIAVPLADALGAAHQEGITHSDLKSTNIMVGDDGRVKILDFGLAQFRQTATTSLHSDLPTRTVSPAGSISGTVPYMSPEQLRGRPIDPRSDIFSLGVVLYEMSTGRRPFGGETPADLVASILKDTPRSILDINPALPRHLARIITHCLEKELDHRLQSAIDLRNELASLGSERDAEEPAPGPSIAVLPFTDMSREKDQEYFCEGIAEEIIIALTKLKGLQVASRTSTFRLKETSLGSRDIGRKLRVRHLLEGSVRKSGDRLRITVEMTDVAGGYHLWSERFDCQMQDIFAIQDEIATNVARNLECTLGPGEQRAMRRAKPSHIKAYDFYLRGRNYYYQYRRKSMEFALQMFSRAIEIDPSYALAYAGIADCSCYLYLYDARSQDNRDRVESASRKALALDPDLAQAHTSRGMALSLRGLHDEAEQAFEMATKLDPRLFEAHYFHARDAFAQGKLDKALQQYERAIAVRPEDYQCPLLCAQIYTSLGREAEAEATRRRGLALAEDRLKTHPHEVRALYLGAGALINLGQQDLGLQWADRALTMEPDDSMLLYNVGCIKSLAGRIDDAIDCLEKAYRAGLTQREWYENDSDLDPVRRHPRFLALLELMERAP